MKKIVIVDDKLDELKQPLRNVLEPKPGYELKFLESCEDLTKKVEEDKNSNREICLVVLDLKMPEGRMQGEEALPKVTELRPDLPVIILTQKSEPQHIVKCMKLGATDYVQKGGKYLKVLPEKVEETLKERTATFFMVGDFDRLTNYEVKSVINNIDYIHIEEDSNHDRAVNKIKDDLVGDFDVVFLTGEGEGQELPKIRASLEEMLKYQPNLPIVVISQSDKTEKLVEIMQIGAYDVFSEKKPEKERFVQIVEESFRKAKWRKAAELVGNSSPMQKLQEQIDRYAPNKASLLILGETGTGKELVAKLIHKRSKRRRKPFAAVNIGAIPTYGNLLEDALFGHSEGTFFTNDPGQLGVFERGNGGTVFLDEIGDASPEIQAQLLRVIQEKQITRLSGETLSVDFRLVTATNKIERVLPKAYGGQENLRPDLYYRLSEVTIFVPPLRRRKEDIPELVRYFVEKHCIRNYIEPMKVDDNLIEGLKEYDWPGNVRELEHMISRAIISSRGKEELGLYQEDLQRLDF